LRDREKQIQDKGKSTRDREKQIQDKGKSNKKKAKEVKNKSTYNMHLYFLKIIQAAKYESSSAKINNI
jgi:hypothetical protein